MKLKSSKQGLGRIEEIDLAEGHRPGNLEEKTNKSLMNKFSF